MAIDQVVHVIAVGDRLMAAARSVDMPGRMAAAGVIGRAAVRVLAVHAQTVFVDMVTVHVVQVAVVKVVDMVIVLDGGMSAARLVLMGVARMLRTGTHVPLLTRH